MNKSQLISEVSDESGFSKVDTEKFIAGFISVLEKVLSSGEEIVITGFGSFRVSERKARTARNFKTKESINVPASNTVKFKAGKNLKDVINKKR